jgi:hypothetical protein
VGGERGDGLDEVRQIVGGEYASALGAQVVVASRLFGRL